jgi:hypothetical protein
MVGGQMVHLHCWERGAVPGRPTADADTVLDVRARPDILFAFTQALQTIGFDTAGQSWEGHQHRWVRDSGQIDILIPRHLGFRAANRRGVTGGTTLETPGAQGALRRAEPVLVDLDGVRGAIRRPTLAGAIAAKAAAYTVHADTHRARHLIDLAVLSTLVVPSDRVGGDFTATERGRVLAALNALEADRALKASVPGADDGTQRLRLALGKA